ncbi:MAG: electron transfer flavoprotein subunit alpha/FixB family protein [Coriobacteriales bacterium]|jgi:electron transfer flavoprotein alpha subunit
MSTAIVYGDTPEQLAYCAAAASAVGADAVGVTLENTGSDGFEDCGAQKVIVIDGAECAEQVAQQVADLVQAGDADMFLAASGYNDQTLAALVAGLLDWPIESGVSSLDGSVGSLTVTRLLYGGAVSRDETVTGPCVVTVPAGVFDPASGLCTVEHVVAQADERIEVVSAEAEKREGADLTKAERVLGIGMGMRTDEDFALAKELAEALNAEISGTRGMAEERGWLDNYIGISGLTIQPDLYVAVAIAGQVQHVFGIRGSKIIVGINNNADAPIFKACDYGIVGDFHEIVPLLIQALS